MEARSSDCARGIKPAIKEHCKLIVAKRKWNIAAYRVGPRGPLSLGREGPFGQILKLDWHRQLPYQTESEQDDDSSCNLHFSFCNGPFPIFNCPSPRGSRCSRSRRA